MQLDPSDYIFMVTTYEEGRSDVCRYLSLPNCWVFPDVDIQEYCPELIIIIEALRDVTGMGVYLGMDPDEPFPYADEVVISNVVVDGQEYLQYVISPLGPFHFIFMGYNENGRLYEVDPVRMSQEIREALWLKDCTIGGDDEVCEVKNVGEPPEIQFSPEGLGFHLFDVGEWYGYDDTWNSYDDEWDDSYDGYDEYDEYVEFDGFENLEDLLEELDALLEELEALLEDPSLEIQIVDDNSGEIITMDNVGALRDLLDDDDDDCDDHDAYYCSELGYKEYVIRIT